MSSHSTKTRILMVCLGNICRSPLAHGILESKLPSNHFFVDSAGTAAYHVGELPDSRSIAEAKINGIDITNQRARQFKVSDFDIFDFIYAMDSSNYNNIIALAKTNEDVGKVKLILEEIPNRTNVNLPDPYYGGSEGFTNVFNMLDEACELIAKKFI